MATYDQDFYLKQQTAVQASAEAVIPVVLQFVKPRSVVDVGCGDGTWLSVFKARGVERVMGADGDYVDRGILQIPADCFIPADLSRPFKLEGTFDLAMSLEVAEHLPESSAEGFVDALVNLSRVILFSAAIPFQGGAFHVNEQWQDYWVEKFHCRGYVTIDCLRKRIWDNEDVSWWYAQNTFIFCHKEYLSKHPALKAEYEQTYLSQLRLVHPRKYLTHADPEKMSLRRELKLLPTLVRGYLGRRVGR